MFTKGIKHGYYKPNLNWIFMKGINNASQLAINN